MQEILIFGGYILLRPLLWFVLGVPSIAIIFISLFSFLHHYMFPPLQAILRRNIHSCKKLLRLQQIRF
jgi:hypothetical protein